MSSVAAFPQITCFVVVVFPNKLNGVRSEILNPVFAWDNKDSFVEESHRLADLFKNNFKKYGAEVEHLIVGGPM